MESVIRRWLDELEPLVIARNQCAQYLNQVHDADVTQARSQELSVSAQAVEAHKQKLFDTVFGNGAQGGDTTALHAGRLALNTLDTAIVNREDAAAAQDAVKVLAYQEQVDQARTDLIVQLTPSPSSFDETEFRERCEALSVQAHNGCGLSFELFQQRISFSIEVLLRDLPEADRARAVEIAANDFCYLTPAELEQQQEELAADGCCSHGIDKNCCPAGCGDIDDGFEWDDTEERKWDDRIEIEQEEALADSIAGLTSDSPCFFYAAVGDDVLSTPLFVRFTLTENQLRELVTDADRRCLEAVVGRTVIVEPQWSNPYLKTEAGSARVEIVQAEPGKLRSAQLRFHAKAAESGLTLATSAWKLEDMAYEVEAALIRNTEPGWTECWLGVQGAKQDDQVDRLAQARAAFPEPAPLDADEEDELELVQDREPRSYFSWVGKIFRPRA